MQFAAFLRGINVGGRGLINMQDLKKTFEGAGFEGVQTILASGNVIFETTMSDAEKITSKIESILKKKYKREIVVFVRSINELKRMAADRPFKGIVATSKTRFYVTFLAEFSRGLKIPELPANMKITRMKDDVVFTTVEITPEMNTPDSMASLNRALGPKITARNWNTIEKILRAATD